MKLTEIKSIPIADVLQWLGYDVRKSGSWLSVKGDDSLKANIQRNTYTDFSSKLGGGSVIDLVMHSQGCDFKTACEMLQSRFLGGVEIQIAPPKPKIEKPKKETMKKYLDKDLVAKFLSKDLHPKNGFAQFLTKRFDFVSDVLPKLGVGTNREGAAVFFYQNHKGAYESLKIVPYNSETGKRTSDISIPKGYQSTDGYAQQCFFNEVSIKDAQTVFIVESEKTAVIATLYFQQSDFAFVATGGAQKLNALLDSRLDILQDKRVILLPDNDAAGNGWMDIKKNASSKGYENLELWWLDKESPEGSDLADFILGDDATWQKTFDRQLNKGKVEPIEQPVIVPQKQENHTIDISFDFLEDEPEKTPVQQVKESLQTVVMHQPKPTESEIYWAKRDAEKQGANLPDVSDLIKFFDKQVLPEKVHFFNADGYCYETLDQPNEYVARTIDLLNSAVETRQMKMAEHYAYHLQRLKKNIETGAYMPRKIEEVPF